MYLRQKLWVVSFKKTNNAALNISKLNVNKTLRSSNSESGKTLELTEE